MTLPDRLETNRLALRRPIESDAAEIFNTYAQDALVCRYMVWRPHPDVSATRAFIASCIEAWDAGVRFPYVITRQGSTSAIGMLDARPNGFTLDVGYVLARSCWGQGYMPEAIRSLTTLALAQGYFRIQAFCDVDNLPSQRALEKSGFAREGRLERYFMHPNMSAEPRPCFMYAKCR